MNNAIINSSQSLPVVSDRCTHCCQSIVNTNCVINYNNNNTTNKTHSSTITDICNNQEGVDEVELLSLVEEHIPKYKLRYDTITEFAGYDNNDWYIKTPVLDSEAPVDLSAETIGETLKYFILSGERLSQMTKTYNDIEVVTKLLEEKERDLELAARIGQSLLEQNKVLTNRSEELETELSSTNEAVEKLKFELFNTNERVIQLKHELSMKNGLLQVYCADIEAQELESEEQPHQSLEDKSIGLSNWDELNKRIGSLEEENLRLKCEATSRANDIELEERKELQLIHDCAKQLTEANLQILSFQEEVGRKGEDNVRQQEEITNLVTRVVELQRRVRDLTFECDSLQNALQVSHECQNELSVELIEIKEKYGTLLAAFHELQTEFKKKSRFNTSHYQYMPFADSLASELESTLGSDCSDGELSSLGFRPVRKSAGNQNTGTEEMRCYSPDSVLSGDSFYYRYNNPQPMIGSTPYSNNTNNAKNYYMGDKLQIVKPLEGSTILRQWQKLATPHLGVILESLPLVTNKAIKDLDKELLEFTVNSMKECLKEGEKEVETKKHMNFVTTNSIYTYTTTSLSHITDSTSVTNSFSNVQLSTGVQSPIPTATSTTSSFTSNLFSHIFPRIRGENITTTTASLGLINENKTNIKTTLNTNSQPLGSTNLDDSDAKSMTLREDLSQKEVESSRESGVRLNESHIHAIHTINAINSEPSKSSDHSVHSIPKQTSKGTTGLEIGLGGLGGLGGMSSLLSAHAGDGVITKCNSLLSKHKSNVVIRQEKPNSLSIKSTQNTNNDRPVERTGIADFSVIKTLRKGGFV